MNVLSSEQEQRLMKQILSLADEQAVQRIQQKAIEFTRLMSYFQCAMMAVEVKFKVLNAEYLLELKLPGTSLGLRKSGKD